MLKRLLFLTLLLPLFATAQQTATFGTITGAPGYYISGSGLTSRIALYKSGSPSYWYPLLTLQDTAAFKKKLDSVSNSGYVTHGYLANYVTLNTPQTITGKKSFTDTIRASYKGMIFDDAIDYPNYYVTKINNIGYQIDGTHNSFEQTSNTYYTVNGFNHTLKSGDLLSADAYNGISFTKNGYQTKISPRTDGSIRLGSTANYVSFLGGDAYDNTGLRFLKNTDRVSDSTYNADNYLHLSGANQNVSQIPTFLNGFKLPNTTFQRLTIIYCMGDSMTASGFYVSRLQADLGTLYLVVNLGISGGWAYNMDNRFGQVTNGSSKFVVIRGGVNDLVGGMSGAQVIASVQSMITKANAAGMTPVIMTISPFSTNAAWTSGIEIQRNIFNAYVRASSFSGTYKRVDASVILKNPADSTQLNPIYSADGLHQNTAGYNIVADSTFARVAFTTNNTASTINFTAKSLTFDQDVSTAASPVFARPVAQSFTATGASNVSDGTPSIWAIAGANNNYAFIAQQKIGSQRYPVMAVRDSTNANFIESAYTGSTPGEFLWTLKPQGISTKGLLVKGLNSSYSANYLEAQDYTGATLTNIRFDGTIGTPGVYAQSGSSHAALNLTSTGAVLIHQDADSNPVVDITNFNAGATGDFVRFKRGNTILGGIGWKGWGVGTTNHTSSFQVTRGTTGLGTVSTTSGLNTVSGTNCDFTVRFKTGQTITVAGESQTITTITDDNNMTISSTWTGTNTNVAYTHTSFSAFTANLNGDVKLPLITGNGVVLYTTSTGLISGVTPATGVLHNGTTPSFSPVSLSSDVTGSLPAAAVAGITGTQGALLVKATTTTLGEVPDVAIGNVLVSSGTGVAPAYSNTPNLGTPSAVVLTNATGFPYATGGFGVLPVANGGTPPIDNSPIAGSTNIITSGGVYTSILNNAPYLNTFTTQQSRQTLPLNITRIIYFGDSFVANGFNIGSDNDFHSIGFTTHLMMQTGGKMFQPPGGNFGVGGNTTTQMLARAGAAQMFNADVVIIEGGTNDINANETAANIVQNLTTLIDGFLSSGKKVIYTTIIPRFSPATFTAPQLAVMNSVNATMLAMTTPGLTVVDESTAGITSGDMQSDGIHTNSVGAYKYAVPIATALTPYLNTNSSINGLFADNALSLNPTMTGTSGGRNGTGITGNVLNSYTANNANSGGATVVCSKTAVNNTAQQVVTISGTKTGTNNNVQLLGNSTFSISTKNDVEYVQILADFEITQALTNINGVHFDIDFKNAAGGDVAEDAGTYHKDDNLLFPYGLGRYQVRGVPIRVPAGTAGIVVNVYINETDGTSLAVAGEVKFWSFGVTRVPYKDLATDLPPTLPFTYLKNIFVPTTGQTVALIGRHYNIINPAGTIAALTLTAPASPADGDVVKIKFIQAVTTLTLPTAFKGMPTTAAAGNEFELVYDSASTFWY